MITAVFQTRTARTVRHRPGHAALAGICASDNPVSAAPAAVDPLAPEDAAFPGAEPSTSCISS